jgi:hypothetical protein
MLVLPYGSDSMFSFVGMLLVSIQIGRSIDNTMKRYTYDNLADDNYRHDKDDKAVFIHVNRLMHMHGRIDNESSLHARCHSFLSIFSSRMFSSSIEKHERTIVTHSHRFNTGYDDAVALYVLFITSSVTTP